MRNKAKNLWCAFVAPIKLLVELVAYQEKKNERKDASELVEELEYFWIEEAVARKLANEFQPKNLEMLTQKDYQFSPTHYGFLYNSLKKYIKNNCPDARSFLNATIAKNENSLDQSLLSLLSSFVVAFMLGYVIDQLDSVTKIILVLVCIYIEGALTLLKIRNIVLGKPKRSFYLSVLNQLKEDVNSGLIKVDSSKAPDPAEENPTADLPVVNNDNADKS